MRFAVKTTLTDEEVRVGLRNVIKDGLTSQTMGTLTGGIFLVAFALKLGASNMAIGLLAAIPSLTQLLQIPSIYLVEKVRNRRAITTYALGLSRIVWLLITLIPFLFSIQAGLTFLIVAILLHTAFASVANCSWNSWMRDLLPQDRLGGFFTFLFKSISFNLTVEGSTVNTQAISRPMLIPTAISESFKY